MARRNRCRDFSLHRKVDPRFHSHYLRAMRAVEFTVELKGERVMPIPEETAAQLPKAGRARVIILTDDGSEDAEWHHAASEQFCRDDASEDAVYDTYK
jgi:hypothetical protein